MPAVSHAQQEKPLEVFGGYSYVRFDSTQVGFPDKSNLNGANIAASFRIYQQLGVVADVSANFGNNQNLYNFLIGPQFAFSVPKGTLFTRFLYGRARDRITLGNGFSSIGRSIAFGGGYDLDYNHRISIRLIQVDYLNTHDFGKNQGNFRISTGIVFQFFGKK